MLLERAVVVPARSCEHAEARLPPGQAFQWTVLSEEHDIKVSVEIIRADDSRVVVQAGVRLQSDAGYFICDASWGEVTARVTLDNTFSMMRSKSVTVTLATWATHDVDPAVVSTAKLTPLEIRKGMRMQG